MSGDNEADMEKLARAFEGDNPQTREKTRKRPAGGKMPFVLFGVGVVALVIGLAFLIIKAVSGPSVNNAEFLISAGEWVKEGEPKVIWDFTEVGKGKLTTDGHLNDYKFIWSIEGNKLKIETTWLYDLNDEFEYSLDQGAKVLTLKNPDKNIEVKFRVAENTE